MSKKIKEKLMLVDDKDLMPGKPLACPGNGEHKYLFHCDECDHFLRCHPDFYTILEEIKDDKDEYIPSHQFKINMNRIIRENSDSPFIPYPEVDCEEERNRSRIIVALKRDGFFDEFEEDKKT